MTLFPAVFAVPAAVAFAGMVLGCSDGTGPGAGRAGDYSLNSVHFSDMLPQPVPAVHVVGSDTTVVERGDITLGGEDQCTLDLVYRWRYGGVPGGATVTDTLVYTFEGRAPFRSQGLVEGFRLLRSGVHIAYLLRRGERMLILIDYDQAGSMDFYFHR